MLTYFHKNKLRYEKGQLAPFFILILAVLIIMAMVTVNLSKVAFIKTDSSNAVDSGALAAGSLMANVFNAVASTNSQMEAQYWQFYAATSISFAMALVILVMANSSASAALNSAISAAGSACSSPCSAIGLASAAAASAGTTLTQLIRFMRSVSGIIISVTAFQIAQYYFYLNLRKMADSEEVDEEGKPKGGRQRAINLGHRFAFINSGLGSKLKEGSAPSELTEQAQKNNFRNEFSRFLDNLSSNEEYTYQWEDGEQRGHYVRVKTNIDPVDTFELQVAVLPLAAELALLGSSLYLSYGAQASLTTAQTSYGSAEGWLSMACAFQAGYFRSIACCGRFNPGCCAAAAYYYEEWMTTCAAAARVLSAGITANAAALSAMTSIFPLMAAAWVGLLPGPIITDSDGDSALPFIISWVDDIEHNRLARVETTQHHEGADLGLWETRYPDTHSYSVVNFSGQGQIHPPVLKHDASITQTDTIGSGAPEIKE